MTTPLCEVCWLGGRSAVTALVAVPVMRRMRLKYPGVRFWIEVDGEVFK